MTRAERFWIKVDRRGTGECWPWLAALDGHGYGVFWTGSRLTKAYRFAYEQIVGEIPPRRELDHLCRNPVCVNPAHLEAVTHAENIRRAVPFMDPAKRGTFQRNKTHCKNGHEFTPENTYRRTDVTGRQCKTCRRERMRVTRGCKSPTF